MRNKEEIQGKTQLMQIVAAGEEVDLANQLIQQGAKLLDKDSQGNTVLYWAEKSQNPDMVNLIEDSLIEEFKVKPRDPEDHFTASLYVNYKQGELAITSNFDRTANYDQKNRLHKLYVELNQKEQKKHSSWELMLATLRIHKNPTNESTLETLKSIKEHQDSIAKTKNEIPALTKTRDLMLMLAAMNGYDSTFTYLLENGANPHHKLDGITPWMLAIINGNTTIAEKLLDTADYDKTDLGPAIASLHKAKNGFTPLMLAAQYGQLDLMNRIIEKVKNQINPDDDDYANALSNYLGISDEDYTKTLPSYLSLTNDDGYSALSLAVRYNHTKAAEALITGGADPKTITHHKDTLLMLAARQGSHDMINLILGHDIDMNAVNLQRETALKIAHKANNKEGIAALLKHAYKLHFTGSPIRYWPQIFIQKYSSNTPIQVHPEGRKMDAGVLKPHDDPLADLSETGKPHGKNIRPEGPKFP